MLKVLLINDTRNWYHFGCQATSQTLVKKIQELGCELTTFPIKKVYEIAKTKGELLPSTVAGFVDDSTCQKFMENNPDLVKSISDSDAIVINGEGTPHGLNPAPLFLLYTAYIAKTKLGKHVEIINHSAYPEHYHDAAPASNSQANDIYKLVYNTLDFAAFREQLSLDTMQKLLEKKNLTKSFDCMPLYIRDEYLKKQYMVEKKPKQILVGGSALWAKVKDMLQANTGGVNAEYKRTLTELSNYFKKMQDDGFSLKFLVSDVENSSQDDQDFMSYMKKEHGINFDVCRATSLDLWLETIAESALLVSGRFHHTIAAFCLGTPFVAFDSNTSKVRSVVNEFKLENLFLEYKSKNFCTDLINAMEKALKNVDINSLNKPNNEGLNELCAQAVKNFTQLNKLVLQTEQTDIKSIMPFFKTNTDNTQRVVKETIDAPNSGSGPSSKF